MSSPVDCKPGNSTRSPDPCNATCGAEGRRTVRFTPVVASPAEHGGEECEEEVKEEVEECTGECGTITGRRQEVGTFALQMPFISRFFEIIYILLGLSKSIKLLNV